MLNTLSGISFICNCVSSLQNARREKLLVERLMRQCQQERRVATQLMAIRKEKDTIRNNRIHQQQQYEEERLVEFNQALDREKVSGSKSSYCM